MSANGIICGWHSLGRHELNVTSVLSNMLEAHQPTSIPINFNEDKNIATSGTSYCCKDVIDVVVSGEPYWNTKELSALSSDRGHAYVVAKLNETKELSWLEYIRGRFIVYSRDIRKQKAIIAIDRIGQQNIYYATLRDNLVFSTRADAVVAHPLIDGDLNSQGVYNYFFYHSVPSQGSIFSKINKLENGCYLEFCEDKLSVKRYWYPQFMEVNNNSIHDLSQEMNFRLNNSVERCINGESVGAFLSGGLDSSTVAGILSNLSNSKVNTYSIGFNAKGYDEMEYARIASSHFDTIQNEYYVTPKDVVAEVPRIAQYFDEPFGNSSALPAYFCAKMAKNNGTKRLLAGDGGDELFAGNERYARQAIFGRYDLIPKVIRSFLLEPLFVDSTVFDKLPIARKIGSYISQAKIPLPDRLETYNFLHRHLAEDIFSKDFLSLVNQDEPIDIMRNSFNVMHTADPLNKMLFLDWKKTLHDNDLVKVNRMCELADIDVVYPMLDDDLVEFSCQIPSSTKLKNNQLRWFYKKAIENFLPKKIITKTKQGFGLPFGIWTSENQELKDMAYSMLELLGNRQIFKKEFIANTIKMHSSVHAKFYGELVWILMMLELWLQKND